MKRSIVQNSTTRRDKVIAGLTLLSSVLIMLPVHAQPNTSAPGDDKTSLEQENKRLKEENLRLNKELLELSQNTNKSGVYQAPMTYTTDLSNWGVSYYRPQSIDLSAESPPDNWVLPEVSSTNFSCLWGEKVFGHETVMNVLVYFEDDPKTNPWNVYISYDQEKDFTATRPIILGGRRSQELEEFQIKYRGGSSRPYKISIYQNTLNPTMKLAYSRKSVVAGVVDLPQGSHRIVLCDDDADGLYSDMASTAIIIDAGSAGCGSDTGRFSGTSAVKLGESGYFIMNISDDGSRVSFHPATYGVIEGKVLCKSSQSPVAGATVMISRPEFTATTDAAGNYRLSIPVGPYSYVRITAPGYVPLHKRRPQAVMAGHDNRFNAVLDPAKPPPRGKLRLSRGDSYHFLTGELHQHSGGDFYLGYSDGIPKFFSNNFLQQGVRDLGEVGEDLDEIVPPKEGYYAYGVPVIKGHTYVSPAKEGEDNSYIIFKVIDVNEDGSCKIEFYYRVGQ